MPKKAQTHDRDAALAEIRKAMIEKKLTQAELADAADCHEKTVQNLLGGRSVVVTINDRGPYLAGRVIDLSKGAAGVIGMQGAGVVPVSLSVLGR